MTETLGLITLTDPMSPASEAYRTLRLNLQFATLDRALRTLLVTSAGTGEGKSTCLANLAVTMAQVEQRVIAVDCDLRRPQLHELFGVSNEAGLTNMMVDDKALDTPPLCATSVSGLSVLPSGALPPRPADLLGSKRMRTVLERLLQEADVLLLDGPPVLAAPDAAVLSSQVDGVLLVVSAGQTKRDHAQHAIDRLNKASARLLGAVLNNASVDMALQGYYK
jgi:non-specific protein-tyrosine kinase